MKKTIYILSLLFVGLLFSCSDDDGAYRPTPSEFSVSQKDFTVEAAGSNVSIMIKAGNLGWSITSDQNWVTASKNFGSGDQSLSLTIIKNETQEKRIANVVIKPTFGLEPVKISITQN